MGRHDEEPKLFFLLLFLMGRNTRDTIETAEGPESRTIPTAPGGPPNEVTMAAMVLFWFWLWSGCSGSLKRWSLVRTSVLCEAWGSVGVLGERVERERDLGERWDKSKAMAGSGGGVGLNHKEWLVIRLRSDGRIAIATVGS
ncbi:hypothetical protein SO802_032918 [Lithocarpus litseifolius]|uniref:Uncharacterized protein n=1 Tax=Lithocarpus litseifolius TaxID=425828 RepID=A0AAW2BCY5_9ROSI